MDRILGLLLFLPVPLVLWLFTRAPLGALASLALGTAIMASHRLYARPFALARAMRRCLWCGGAVGAAAVALEVSEPFGRTSWRACGEPHARRAAGLLTWASARGGFLKAGILGTLALFLLAATALAAGVRLPMTYEGLSAFFRLGIALTVLPLGWIGGRTRGDAAAPLTSPFPLHIQALVGSHAVVWLFRLVGLAWLGLSLRDLGLAG
ncbi:MAG: hypothetical protein AB7O37_04655 [Vicinamibacteria bacterium]